MKRGNKSDPRALCAQILCEVLERRRYLDGALDEHLKLARDNAALVQEMAYGTLRWYFQLDAIAAQLLARPLKDKDLDLRLLLLIGLYQLRHMRVASHAVVDETVEASAALGKPWAKGFINACLRNYLRNPGRADGIIARDPVARFSHPQWLIDAMRRDRPTAWEHVLNANNERPPMTLRVNQRKQTRAHYLERLHAAGIFANALNVTDVAVALDSPTSVGALPGFSDGEASVQDGGAQLAAVLLDAHPNQRVLDACAAPGGKSAHLLERTPSVDLVAVDIDVARIAFIEQNMKRLGLAATVRVGDAAMPDAWWDGKPFDRILADVPCSATGVIRRHPDIKLRRQPDDLDKLTATQTAILDGLWPTLRAGGKLLYVTCSMLAAENEDQVAAFLARHADATELALDVPASQKCRHGVQILPGSETMDGFFYACLEKR